MKIKEAKRKIEAKVTATDDPSRFLVVMLQEGLGNFGSCFYYTADAIASAVPIYEGAKVYYDHPRASDEEDLPERSVRDIIGHYENVKAVEAEGRTEMRGELVVPPGEQFDGARALMQHALEYAKKFPGKDFVGLSINASGDADEMSLDDVLKSAPEACQEKLLKAKEMGIETVRMTKKITDVVSCDLVTEAGAGGKILKLLEEAKRRKKEMGKKKQKQNANPAADQDHADKDQDVQLIKGMLDKHMGDGKHDEADAKLMKKALQAYQAAGHEGEEAEKMAAAHVKAAKHMAQSEAEETESGEAESEAEETEAEAESEAESESEDADGDDDGDEAPAPGKKKKPAPAAEGEGMEALKKEKKEADRKVITLTAENGALKERLGKLELQGHIEKKLEESKLPRSATKLVRESAKDVKTVAEFDKHLKIFVEARKHALGEAESGFEDVFANPERETKTDDAGSGLSFADAVEE